jgi:outer membrane protein
MKTSWLLVLAFFIVLAGISRVAVAGKEPLWEVGAGVGGVTLPDYVGSSGRQSYGFPIPYLVYNGKLLQIDRNGLQGHLFKSPKWRLEFSGNLGAPVRSTDDGVRQGMPGLDPTFEIGPSVYYLLSETREQQFTWSLRFPLRGVFSTDFKTTEQQGWTFAPYLNFHANNVGPGEGWEFGAALGPVFGSERFHNYYYEVAPRYANANRPAYDARGGYSGMRLAMVVSKRFSKVWAGAYLRYDYIGGAVFEDSPLVEQRHALLLGGGISWIFSRSDTWVQVDD